MIFGGLMQWRCGVFVWPSLQSKDRWRGLIPWSPGNWQRYSVHGIEGIQRGVDSAGHCGMASLLLALRGNLSALRLLWSPLLALRMQMFSAQSPSLMDGVLAPLEF